MKSLVEVYLGNIYLEIQWVHQSICLDSQSSRCTSRASEVPALVP